MSLRLVAMFVLAVALFVIVLIFAGTFIFLSRQREVEAFLREASTERITFFERLTDMLKGFKGDQVQPPARPRNPRRRREELGRDQELEYRYPSENGSANGSFCIGPMSFGIEAGEILFIVGGNGSGKSTLVKVLTGLYPLSSGSLRVDGVVVDEGNRASLREMISAIFSDFHLFSKLYGLLDVDPAAVRRLLVKMQIDDKTSFANDRFTRRNLSTGQRKRLAMVVVLLEDRPIYMFDEWAADQDPEFRQYFYEDLLPELKRRGKTVIAVTHDDRYFRCADRAVTIVYGKIRFIERFNAGSAARGGEGSLAESP